MVHSMASQFSRKGGGGGGGEDVGISALNLS